MKHDPLIKAAMKLDRYKGPLRKRLAEMRAEHGDDPTMFLLRLKPMIRLAGKAGAFEGRKDLKIGDTIAWIENE